MKLRIFISKNEQESLQGRQKKKKKKTHRLNKNQQMLWDQISEKLRFIFLFFFYYHLEQGCPIDQL